jgi:hypothetical protein
MRWMTIALAFTVAAVGNATLAQKKPAPAPAAAAPAPAVDADRNAPLYFYLVDGAGNRVLLQTQFALNNLEADTRVLRRFYGVLNGLNQKGFRKSDKVTIADWDKKEKFSKCYIYLEDEESGKGKGTGARVWCSESGISEAAVAPSEDAKHVDRVLERFNFFLAKSRDAHKG